MKKSLKNWLNGSHQFSLVALLGVAIAYNVLVPFPTFSLEFAQSTTDKWLDKQTNAESSFLEKMNLELAARSGAVEAPTLAATDADSHVGLPVIEAVPKPQAIYAFRSTVTVYHSVPWETDGDPWTTASGSRARDGVVAANCLPFGTKLRLPDLFGDKVFTVEDRLAPRKGCYIVDVWMEYSPSNKSFGAPVTTIEVLEGSPANALARL
jgi:hypothetical protein